MMKNRNIIASAAAVLLGAVGYYLRQMQLENAFEAGSRLAIATDRWTVLLAVCSFAAVTAALLCAFLQAGAKQSTKAKGADALLGCVGAVMLLIGGGLQIGFGVAHDKILLVKTILGLASGAVLLVYHAADVFGKRWKSMKLLSIFPAMYFCFALILLYVENAANPVLTEYGVDILAVASACMSFYYFTGILSGKTPAKRYIFCHFLGVYFMAAAMAGKTGPELWIFAGTLCILLYQLLGYTFTQKTEE